MEIEKSIDTGANELKLLEFRVGDESFGINIAKVSEIIHPPDITPMPSAPNTIEGVFMHRDKLVTVIDLHKVLELGVGDELGVGLLIICDFEKLSIAFHVSAVIGICTLNWSVIEKPPAIQSGAGEGLTTGIAKVDDKMLMMLDFEKIVCDLSYGKDFEVAQTDEIEPIKGIDYSRHIIIAEDSPFLSKVVVDAIKKIGFYNVDSFSNGLDAWNHIVSKKSTGKIRQEIAAVISDIEMPLMDGHSLTRFIKGDKELRSIPVFLFSSLIHENVRMRGDSAGADGQFARSELNELIKLLLSKLTK